MISLQVENYCQNCPDFEPYQNVLRIGRELHTIVQCTHKDRCNEIYKYICQQYEKDIEDDLK